MDTKINGQKFKEKQDSYIVSIDVSLKIFVNYKKKNSNFIMDKSG